MFAVANKQQFKIKMYKKQIEEAGEGDHRLHPGQVQGGSAGAGGGQQAAVQERAGQQGGAREGAWQLLP